MFESPHGMFGLFKTPKPLEAPPAKEIQPPPTSEDELASARIRLGIMSGRIDQLEKKNPSDSQLNMFRAVVLNIERHIASLEEQIKQEKPTDPPERL
jgi:hypothetical protein